MLTLMLGGCGSGKEKLPGDSNTEGVSSVNVTSSEESSEDAGLDSNEVLEEQTTQVTFYFFRATDGSEYYLCDFLYNEGDSRDAPKWYTNYGG